MGGGPVRPRGVVGQAAVVPFAILFLVGIGEVRDGAGGAGVVMGRLGGGDGKARWRGWRVGAALGRGAKGAREEGDGQCGRGQEIPQGVLRRRR